MRKFAIAFAVIIEMIDSQTDLKTICRTIETLSFGTKNACSSPFFLQEKPCFNSAETVIIKLIIIVITKLQS